MATAPVADQQALLIVQALDTRAQQLVHQRRTLPLHATIAEFDAQLAELERALVASRTAVSDLRGELAKAEADVAQVRARAQRDQKMLDDGAVGAKDAQSLLNEIQTLSGRQSQLEEIEIDVMERLEAHESTLSDLEEAHAKSSAARSQAVAERDEQVSRIDGERKQVAAKRQQAITGLDAGLLATYERLRDQLGGLAAAKLEGRMCGGCRMQLNPVDLAQINGASPETIVRCEECGRILVRSTPEE